MGFRPSLSLLFFISLTLHSIAQGESEVYVANLVFSEENFQVENFKNISNNPGYDNQPYFTSNEDLLYVRNNEGQTDIARHSLSKNSYEWVNKSTPGSEYSPQSIPNSNDIAAVRLDPDGKQRLYRYDTKGEAKEYLPDLEVAYYTLSDRNILVASVLAGGSLDLVLSHGNGTPLYKILKQSGRSIHRIPGSSAISYSAYNEEKNLDVYQLDMESLESFFICQLPIGIQDYAWWDDYKIFIGSGAKLYVYDLYGSGDWQEVADLTEYPIQNITRIAISPDFQHLALVAEPKN